MDWKIWYFVTLIPRENKSHDRFINFVSLTISIFNMDTNWHHYFRNIIPQYYKCNITQIENIQNVNNENLSALLLHVVYDNIFATIKKSMQFNVILIKENFTCLIVKRN